MPSNADKFPGAAVARWLYPESKSVAHELALSLLDVGLPFSGWKSDILGYSIGIFERPGWLEYMEEAIETADLFYCSVHGYVWDREAHEQRTSLDPDAHPCLKCEQRRQDDMIARGEW
jgi:hypothetical protein